MITVICHSFLAFFFSYCQSSTLLGIYSLARVPEWFVLLSLCRCFFLDKLQEKFLCDKANDSMEVDEESSVGDQMEVDQQDEDIHSMIRSCKFNMKLKMIESARKQVTVLSAKLPFL